MGVWYYNTNPFTVGLTKNMTKLLQIALFALTLLIGWSTYYYLYVVPQQTVEAIEMAEFTRKTFYEMCKVEATDNYKNNWNKHCIGGPNPVGCSIANQDIVDDLKEGYYLALDRCVAMYQ